MYESPIEIIMGDVITHWENGIFKAVQTYDVRCNKEELIKALEYDRNQYQKGYEDGRPKWIQCSERLPEESGRYLTTNSGWGDWITDWNIWTGDHWYYTDRNPVAWMPMPRPYGEE